MGISSIINKNQITVDSTSAYARTVGVIESPITINVPSEFATLQAALDWVESRVLLAQVTIQIADGSYDMGSSMFTLIHPNYLMVSIVGNQTTPANVTFSFSGTGGFLAEGCILRALKGIKVSGSASGFGVRAIYGGGIMELRDVVVDGASYGINTIIDSFIKGYDITVNNCSTFGAWALLRGTIVFNNITATNNGTGISAQFASTVQASGVRTLSGNSTDYAPGLGTAESNDGSYIGT